MRWRDGVGVAALIIALSFALFYMIGALRSDWEIEKRKNAAYVASVPCRDGFVQLDSTAGVICVNGYRP